MWDWRGRLKIGAYTAELGKCEEFPRLEEVCVPVLPRSSTGYYILLAAHREHLYREVAGSDVDDTVPWSLSVFPSGLLGVSYRQAITIMVASHVYPPFLPTHPSMIGVESFPFLHAHFGARRHPSATRWHRQLLRNSAKLGLAAEGWDEGTFCGCAGSEISHPLNNNSYPKSRKQGSVWAECVQIGSGGSCRIQYPLHGGTLDDHGWSRGGKRTAACVEMPSGRQTSRNLHVLADGGPGARFDANCLPASRGNLNDYSSSNRSFASDRITHHK